MADMCGLCYSLGLTTLLDMGSQPIAERMGSETLYPLKLMMCPNCQLVQLSQAPPAEELFPPDHPYASGNTRALREHFSALAAELRGSLRTGDLVVDIGANDGTFLSYMDGVRRVAVEPTDQILKCPPGVERIQEFFTAATGFEIAKRYGDAKIVTAFNVLAHVPAPHDFAAGVARMLSPDGWFITENHDVSSVITGNQIDTVYHEHARYYSPATLSRLLEENGLWVEHLTRIGTHGGSFRVIARKAGFPGDLANRADEAAAALNTMLWEIHDRGERVYGVGAATRATPLIHFAGLARFLDCVCEVPGSEKIGLTMPGTNLKVVDEVALVEDQPEYALLFSWHVKDSIVPKLREVGYRGKFIVPLPKPEIIDE